MALTRAFLAALNIPEAAIQPIIDEHMTSVNGVKTEWENKYNAEKAKADGIPALEKDLKDETSGKTYKELYTAEKQAHEALQSDIAGKAAKAAKEAAVKQYFTEKKVKADSLNLAIRATNIDSIELDEAGKIKDSKALDALLEGDLKPLITTETKKVIDSGAHLGEGGKPANTYNLRDAISEKYGK